MKQRTIEDRCIGHMGYPQIQNCSGCNPDWDSNEKCPYYKTIDQHNYEVRVRAYQERHEKIMREGNK